MGYLIIGDIHGCYYTLRDFLDKYWDSNNDVLISVGDIVNKGKHTFAVVEYILNLQKKFSDNVIVLKGNNEYLFEQYYRDKITLSAKQKFENYNLDYLSVLNWMNSLPHVYDNKYFCVTHAGIAEDKSYPIAEDDVNVLFNRKKLKNLKKPQFLGHVVVDKIEYHKKSNSYYLDTGAGYGKKLSGVLINKKGTVKKEYSLKIHSKDISTF